MRDEIIELALKAVTKELDDLITTILNDQVDNRTIMKARACLPEGYKNSFHKSTK